MWWPRSCSWRSLLNCTVWPEMQVGTRGVETFLDAQRLAAFELCDELGLDDQLVGAALEHGELVVDVGDAWGRGESATIRRLPEAGAATTRVGTNRMETGCEHLSKSAHVTAKRWQQARRPAFASVRVCRRRRADGRWAWSPRSGSRRDTTLRDRYADGANSCGAT